MYVMKKKKKGMIKMTPNKYQKAALRTESPLLWMKADDNSLRILHGLMGLNGEAGEAIDIFQEASVSGPCAGP